MKRLIFLMTLVLSSNVLSTPANTITCYSKVTGYELTVEEVDGDVNNQAIVTLRYQDDIIGKELAVYKESFRETDPPQIIREFNFVEDEEFLALSINTTRMSGYMKPGLVNWLGQIITIDFETCK